MHRLPWLMLLMHVMHVMNSPDNWIISMLWHTLRAEYHGSIMFLVSWLTAVNCWLLKCNLGNFHHWHHYQRFSQQHLFNQSLRQLYYPMHCCIFALSNCINIISHVLWSCWSDDDDDLPPLLCGVTAGHCWLCAMFKFSMVTRHNFTEIWSSL